MAVGQDLSRLSISQLHELTGRERRWIKKRLGDAGLEPVSKDGRTTFFASRTALAAIYGKSQINASDEIARLNKARADLAELDLLEREGALVPAPDVELAILAITSPIALRLDALPVKAAPEVRAARTDAEAEATLRRLINQARTELADLSSGFAETDPPGGSGSDGGGDRGTPPPA